FEGLIPVPLARDDRIDPGRFRCWRDLEERCLTERWLSGTTQDLGLLDNRISQALFTRFGCDRPGETKAARNLSSVRLPGGAPIPFQIQTHFEPACGGAGRDRP